MEHRVKLRARANHHFAYSGRCVLVTNLDGQVTGSRDEGFYAENTRLLSCDLVTVNGEPIKPVVASPVDGAALLAYFQIPQELVDLEPQGSKLPEHALFVEHRRRVGEGLRSELRFTNYRAHAVASCELALHLDADFADILEAMHGQRQQQADVEREWNATRQELTLRYCHPDFQRAVAIRVEQVPGPLRYEDGALHVALDLHPHQSADLDLVVEPIIDGQRWSAPSAVFGGPSTELERVRQQLRDEIPALTTTNTSVALAWRTATRDLASLPLGMEQGPATPIAGIPLYQQFFGRDSLTIAWQALLAMPLMLRDALTANAAWQGTQIDDWRDEEPGKMIHQARRGPLSVLEINPYTRYYGDYATPPDFLIMLGQYLAWTNDLQTVRELLPAARKAIRWLERYADLDHDGFIEYVTRSKKGVKNQGWKDAEQSIVDEQGQLVENPIATSELQAYWYAGLRQSALAFFATGDRAYAFELLGKAQQLQRRFDRAFWMDDLQFYAVGLGPNKQPIRAIASNAGHLLATGIVPRSKARRVAQRLMAPDLFSGWGIRTLSTENPAYNPFSYHLGSVWPVDTGTFALGFGRYGYWEEQHRLVEGLFAVSDLFVENRIPEVITGLPRDEQHPHPGIYPESNEPQGWSASAIVLVVQALLGLRPLAPLGLLLVDPHLPAWLPDLRLEGIRMGKAAVDLHVWRTRDGTSRYRAVQREGSVRVLRQPPPDGSDSAIINRLWMALASTVRTYAGQAAQGGG